MQNVRLILLSSTALLIGCTDQLRIPSAPNPDRPRFTVYTATASAPDILGAYLGSNYTIAYDINDVGTITGVSNTFYAVGWATGTAAAPSSTTPFVVGNGGVGRAINGFGQVAGEYGNNAALWTPSGSGYTLTDIGADPLLASAVRSAAYGMNASGQVVGNYLVAGNVNKCFLWTPIGANSTTGTAVEIPGLGGDFCVGNDINFAGQIAGASNLSAGGTLHGFVRSGGTTIDLQPGADESYGSTINNAGQVAGYHTPAASPTTNATIWNVSGAGWDPASDLTPPAFTGQSGLLNSAVLDINDAGMVVGYTADNANTVRAFFWQSGSFTELTDPGISIVEATALTDVISNRVIVTGADIYDLDLNSRHGLRWAVSLTPVVTNGCLEQLRQMITGLQTAGTLNSGQAKSLLAKVDAAARQVTQGETTAAVNVLKALINEVNALKNAGRLTSTQAQALIDLAQCAIAACNA
jgi:probable HAF family extracellular repeat protein